MADNIVNLRLARKQKKRRDKEVSAEQNRISFGRTKVEKTLSKTLKDKHERELDQKKLETPKSDE